MNARFFSLVLIGISVAYLIVGCQSPPQPQPDKVPPSQVDKTQPALVDDENTSNGWKGISTGEGRLRAADTESSSVVPEGFLSEEKSLQWLSKNGYQVNRNSDVPIRKEVPGYKYAPSISGWQTGTMRIGLPEGVSALCQKGKIYITDKEYRKPEK